MTRRGLRLAAVLLVVGLVVGGTLGGVIGASMVSPGPALEAPGTGAPGMGGSEPGAPGTDAGQTGEATDGGPKADAGGTDAGEPPLSYEALYRSTIDSVVKITVSTDAGQSQGSGFVYDDRHVVTNHHVVGSADSVVVQFADGSYRRAPVVGTDPYTDLAVVRVPDMPSGVDPLPVATEPPRPGQPVVALGSPFGLEGTITHGIVSGVNRSMTVEGGFTIPATVQTDAPINPGNSGGPLVSMTGTVVGVNRAKEGDNVGFAISAAVVQRVVPSLLDDGEYDHAYVGIRSLPVTPAIAERNDLARARGVMVVETVGNGPAAGVLEPAATTTVDGVTYPVGGDVIVAIDGHPIPTPQALSRYLLLHTRPGETISMTVIRDGTRESVALTLAERPPA